MLFLGFSAGLPFLLVFSTLTAWLAQSGLSRATIGFFGWVGLTYSLKVFWAPVVDRLPLPWLTRALGRRRSWMLLAQVGIAAGLLGLAFTDPATQLTQIALFAVLVAFSSATQDITIDAFRIESAATEFQGGMAAAYQLGYRIALITAGAGALFIAAADGWSVAYQTMAALVGIGILTALVIREPVAAPRAPTRSVAEWLEQAIIGPFRDFFVRNGVQQALLILLFIALFRVTDIAMGVMANPFYLDRGYSLEQIASIAKGLGVLMTILGAFAGGFAVAQWGLNRSLILSGVLVIASNLCFALLAGREPTVTGLSLVISADSLAAGMAGTAFIAYLSSLTNTAYTATQYALFSSLMTLPGKFLSGYSGQVADAIGWEGFFLYTSALGIPALLLAVTLLRRQGRVSR
ncbi:MAG: MFS transporter [Pseudomonadota bacterium]